MLRYAAGSDEPIYPIGYVQHRNPMAKKRSISSYTSEGRQGLHDNLRIANQHLMQAMMQQPLCGRSTEYADNRISLFSAQYGKCAITGKEFISIGEIHCHHKTPRNKGGTDKYGNLILVLVEIHKLIHAVEREVIEHYLNILKLDKSQVQKMNSLRTEAGLNELTA